MDKNSLNKTFSKKAASTFAYIGSFTDEHGPGIVQLLLNPDGTLTKLSTFNISSPTFFAINTQGNLLYTVNEIDNFNGPNTTGSVTALKIDPVDGTLSTVGRPIASGGTYPTHISLSTDGNWVFVSNYGSGTVAILPTLGDGSLGEPTQVFSLPIAPFGVPPGTDAPTGSFGNTGHEALHAHQAQLDPSGRFLIVNELATDRIYSYLFDSVRGTVNTISPYFAQATSGAGPRHCAFNPSDNTKLYSLNEQASTINTLILNPNTGELNITNSCSALPLEFKGTSFGSEIAVSNNSQFLYVSNRLHDSIGVFNIDVSGNLQPALARHFHTQGDYPRYFTFGPNEEYMYVCNQRSDNVAVFRHTPNTGQLIFTGKYIDIGSPSFICFVTVGQLSS